MQQTQLQWVADRVRLRNLKQTDPSLSILQLAQQCSHCTTWVKKWLAPFQLVDPDDLAVLWDLPPPPPLLHKTKRPPLNPLIVERILH